MNIETVLKLAPGIGVAIGLAIFYSRQRKTSEKLEGKIRAALASAESLTLPELVTHLGMSDGFMNRGKVLNVLNPMVSAGVLTQEEPPGTTMKNRLSVLRFRLRDRAAAV